MHRLISYISLVVVCLVFAASTTSAQGLPVTPGLELSVSSSNPTPGQTITITARSYGDNITSATIIWTVDGKEVKRGTGASTLETKAPVLGKKSTITAIAITLDGARLSNSITIGSGSVDLIIESDGYVPPFFLGKISPVYENTVKIVAVPHLANSSGVEYDPKTLTYEWRRNETVLESQSGYGKRSIAIDGGIVPRPYTLGLTVRTRDGSAEARAFTTISPQTASLVFYVDDPLYGPLFNKAVGSQLNLGRQRESSILAVPYGFNKPIRGIGNLAFEWTINGSLRSDLAENQSIVLRAPEDSAGSSAIGLRIKNNLNILQGAVGGFTVSFPAPREESDESLIRF